MKKSTAPRTILLLLLSLLIASCSSSGIEESTDKIGVVVSILPQEEFVKSVGGNRVDITVMIPPGASPHTYEATPEQMVKLSKAKMYVKVGSPFEFEIAWLDKLIAINKDMLVVDCSKNIELIQSSDPDEPGMDPHIWTSVHNASIMVRNICDGLVQIDPANKAFYEENRDAYLEKLDALDKDIRSTLDGITSRSFIVYHPAWGYFARDYGLQQLSIEQGGKEPKAAYMARLITEAKANNIKVIFVSPQFDVRNAETIATEIEGRVVIIDPLARNYLDNMRMVAKAFKEALR